MTKKTIADPTVRISFMTSNGVCLVINSFPDANMSSNRWDAYIVGYDFSDIRTNVYLGDVCPLISGIAELEDQNKSISNDAFQYFCEDTSNVIGALGGTSDDLIKLKKAIFDSRNQVLQNKPV